MVWNLNSIPRESVKTLMIKTMKKVFFLFSLLLGALTLSSCIKEAESESVTNVRNSLANLNNANAQAATTLANSQAALDKAQSDLLAAQAKLVAAQAEEQALLNQLLEVQIASAKAELEAQLAEVEVRKAQAAADVKRIAAQLEIDLVNAKTQLIQAQQAYQTAVTAFDTYRANEILDLANMYTIASGNLLNARMQLITLETQKAVLENDLASLNSTKEEIIKNNNAEIESVKKIIAALEATMDMTPEELTVMRNEKSAEVIAANDAYTRALKAQADAQAAIADAKMDITNTFQYYLFPETLIQPTSFTSTQEVVSESGRVIVYGFGTQIALSPLDQASSQNTFTYGYEFNRYDYAIAAISHPSLTEGMIDVYGNACVNAEFRRETFQRAADNLKATAKVRYEEEVALIIKDRDKVEAEKAQFERYVAKVDELLGDKPAKLLVAQQKAAEAKAAAKTSKNALNEYVTLSTAADRVELAEANAVLTEKQTVLDNLNAQIATAKAAMGTPEGYQIVCDLYERMISTYETQIISYQAKVEETRQSMEENQAVVNTQSAKALDAKADYDDADKVYAEARLRNLTEPTEEHATAEAAALAARNDAFTIWKKEAAALELAETNLQTAVSEYQLAQSNLNTATANKAVVEDYLARRRTDYETNKQIVDESSLLLPAAVEEVRVAQIAYDAVNQRVLDQLKDDPKFLRLNQENIDAQAAKTQADADVTAVQTSIDIVLAEYPEYTPYQTELLPTYKIVLLDDEATLKLYDLVYEDLDAQIEVWLSRVFETIDKKDLYLAAITKLNELLETGRVADLDCTRKREADLLALDEYMAINLALSDAQSVKTHIQGYEQEIAAIQARTQQVLTDIKDYETMVAYIDEQIANQKEVIAANEATVKVVKEALDKAIAAGQQQ